MNYLHVPCYMSSKVKHGGYKRSIQISKTIENLGGTLFDPYALNKKEAIRASFHNPVFLFRSFFTSIIFIIFFGVNIKFFFPLVVYSTLLLQRVSKKDFDCVLLEVGPGFPIVFMRLLKMLNVQYDAMPHNIEFMVPSQTEVFFRSDNHLFSNEIFGYKHARRVFVISRHDQIMLSNMGVMAYVYSYYPVADEYEAVIKIREFRKQKEKSYRALLMGTISNPPTFRGIMNFISEIKSLNIKMHNYIFEIAGYGTEKLKAYEGDNVKVLGTLSDKELISVLSDVDMLIISQPQTSGFLTKIVEFNLSGIPVIVISDYFQSENLEEYGVYRVDNIEEVDFILNTKLSFSYFNSPDIKIFLDL
ncbi:hypothetical protein ADIMK_1481 [Marinobacterium lacunae]|uniref:Glycosyltransferase n=1 Tax=Marinobacterium lacunae TaxID=1232683 RepID=A0A081G0D0_9GAMM|nr:glycosyltransferase [Marinobacterium lacunae]KEA64235.1 hypothetical protein ADIMK_1481 [Marinobacterium lacunae]